MIGSKAALALRKGGHPGRVEAGGDRTGGSSAAASDPPQPQQTINERRAAFRAAAADITNRKPRPIRRNQRDALVVELWRGHHRRVFVHQFDLIARRMPPRAPVRRVLITKPYDYRDRFKRCPLGLAAFKHAQAEEARRAVIEASRAGGQVLARDRRRPVENEAFKGGKNREELRHEARQAAIARLRQTPPTLAELCQMHLENGTLDQFLKSLRYG